MFSDFKPRSHRSRAVLVTQLRNGPTPEEMLAARLSVRPVLFEVVATAGHRVVCRHDVEFAIYCVEEGESHFCKVHAVALPGNLPFKQHEEVSFTYDALKRHSLPFELT